MRKEIYKFLLLGLFVAANIAGYSWLPSKNGPSGGHKFDATRPPGHYAGVPGGTYEVTDLVWPPGYYSGVPGGGYEFITALPPGRYAGVPSGGYDGVPGGNLVWPPGRYAGVPSGTYEVTDLVWPPGNLEANVFSV